jgi:hypothetical protein
VASTGVMVMVRVAAALRVWAVEAEPWLGSDACFSFGRDAGLLCAAWTGGCTPLPLGRLSCVSKNIKRQRVDNIWRVGVQEWIHSIDANCSHIKQGKKLVTCVWWT